MGEVWAPYHPWLLDWDQDTVRVKFDADDHGRFMLWIAVHERTELSEETAPLEETK